MAFLRGLGIKGFANIFVSVTRCNCWKWGDGQMKDVVGGKWGNVGMSVPDMIVKFTKVSLVKFSPMKTLILNLRPTHRETSRLTFTFTIKRSLT